MPMKWKDTLNNWTEQSVHVPLDEQLQYNIIANKIPDS